MKKVMLTKYGFIRRSEQDFGDDGDRFTCYRAGDRVRVTKHVSDGQVYIHASIDSGKLPYEVYSKLPHYFALDALNGVAIESLTDERLREFYDNCLLYEEEFIEAENTIVMPTISEIKIQCMRVQAKRQEELAEINRRFTAAVALKVCKWEWSELRDYLLSLEKSISCYDPEEYPQTILNTARSINFCKPDCSELQDSFYYKWIMERVNK